MDFIIVFTLLSDLCFDNPNSKEERKKNKILRESECVTQIYMIIKTEKAFVNWYEDIIVQKFTTLKFVKLFFTVRGRSLERYSCFAAKQNTKFLCVYCRRFSIVDSGEIINVFIGPKHASSKKAASLLSAWSPHTDVIISYKNWLKNSVIRVFRRKHRGNLYEKSQLM
jgi:hypothetical protein